MALELKTRLYVVGAALLKLLIAVSIFILLPIRDSDKEQAVRELVAWIVEGQRMPGFGEDYPDSQWMPGQKRFFVICDFVPRNVSLSDDPRVQRISAKEHDAVFKKHGFNDTTYIVIKIKAKYRDELVFEFSNYFGWLAAHGYQFNFRRTIWGLRANGKFLWVS